MKKVQNNKVGYIPTNTNKSLPKKEKKKVTKVVTFWLLIAFMVVTVIGSVLGTTAFIKTTKADTLAISFNGSNIYMPMSFSVANSNGNLNDLYFENRIDNTNYVANVGYLSLKTGIEYDSSTGKHNFYLYQPYSVVENGQNNPISKAFPFVWNGITVANANGLALPPFYAEYFFFTNNFIDGFSGDNLDSVQSLYSTNNNNQVVFNFNQYVDINKPIGFKTYFYFLSQYYFTDKNMTNQNRAYFDMYVQSTGQITSDISSVTVATKIEDGRFYNVVEYNCSNGNTLSFGFRVTNKVATKDTFTIPHYQPNNSDYLYSSSIMPYSMFKYDFRRYLFVATGSAEYLDGYRDGMAANQSNVWQDGYSAGVIDGKTKGYQNGYDDGYTVGINDGTSYNFMSLLSSVVDAPLTAVRGMLNFEFLGFNMYEFFTSILGICIIVAIIKFIV